MLNLQHLLVASGMPRSHATLRRVQVLFALSFVLARGAWSGTQSYYFWRDVLRALADGSGHSDAVLYFYLALNAAFHGLNMLLLRKILSR